MQGVAEALATHLMTSSSRIPAAAVSSDVSRWLRTVALALSLALLAAYIYVGASHASSGKTIRCISSPAAHSSFERLRGDGHKWHMDQSVFLQTTLTFRVAASGPEHLDARRALEQACGVRIGYSQDL